MKKTLLILLSLLTVSFARAQKVHQFGNSGLVPVKLEGISKKVTDVPEEAPNPKATRTEHENESIHSLPKVNPNALPVGADPAIQQMPNNIPGNIPASTTAANILSNWAGLSAPVEPSDNNIAVGPNHVVQLTNNNISTYMRIWDKTGKVLVSNKTIKSFSGINDYGDPNIVYDQIADRYVMVFLYSKNAKQLEVCVSVTNNPTGSWYVYSFNTPNGFPDYPKIGVWGNSYFITTNSRTPTIYALNRSLMLAGKGTGSAQMFSLSSFPSLSFQSGSPVSQTGSIAPPANAPANIIRVADDAWGTSVGPDHLEIFNLSINWTTPSLSTISGPVNLNTIAYNSKLCSFSSGSCIPQPGSTVKLDPLSDIVMDKVQYRNFGDHEALVCSHVCNADGNGNAGIRWYELRKNSSGNWFIYQQSTYFPTTDCRFMSSISINGSGAIALGYNISSSTVFPSIGITGRDSCDVLNNMTVAENKVVAGSAANSSIRYGDYNGMVTDPTDGSFWFTGQYNASPTWSTNVTHFTLGPCAAGARVEGAEVTSLDNSLKNSLKIIPNPASDEVQIQFSSEAENVQLQIADMTGKLIWESSQKATTNINTAMVNTHAFVNGYYLVRVMDGKNVATSKLVIER